MSRFRIVTFVAAHLPELTDLWVEAWSRAMPAIDFRARRAWFVEHLVAMTARDVVIVCAFDSADGRMAGFVTYDKSGHIDQLVAGVHAWGTGAAAALLEEAKRARTGVLHLDVNQDNPRAVRFYEREGFSRASAGVNRASGLATWHYVWRRSG